MFLFPVGSRFAVITDLKLTDATNCRSPRQLPDDVASAIEWIECDAMLGRPTVFRRGREHRLLVSNVGVLERELPHAEFGQPFDVARDRLLAVDVAASHHAGGSHFQAASRIKEATKSRGRDAHQTAILRLIEVMS